MPLIKVETNAVPPRADETVKALSSLAADMLGKPEQYVLAILEDDKEMTFGGTNAPAAFVTLHSIGLPEDRTPEFSASICSFLETAMGIPSDRIYIAFGNLERHLFGWNSKTF